MTRMTTFCGEQAILLENDSLRAVILPERGGKAASLFCKETGMEILYQNGRGVYKDASFGSDFGDFEACGFDDAFPTVDVEKVEVGGELKDYPDHGEIWSAAFAVEPPLPADADAVSLSYYSRRLGYTYRKIFSLVENRLRCDYRIENVGAHELPYVWTMHCLVNVTPDMRLVFPKGTDQVQNVFTCAALGEAEAVYPFPEAQIGDKRYRFDRLPEDGMVKYYALGRVAEGCCGYDYPETATAVRIHFDPEKLPYLGCWITAGGYRGEKNCALEPCTGYYDSVGKARRLSGDCASLAPGEELRFTLEIEAKRQ